MAVPPTYGKVRTLAADPGEIAAAKAELRQRLRFRRDHFVSTLSDFERMAAFRAAPPPLRALIGSAEAVGGYCATASEAPVDALIQIAQAEGVATALPRCLKRDAYIRFSRWSPGEPVERGPWRVNQPLAGSPALAPDLLLVPLLGFDRSGGRLGQGGGHFDRYGAAHPAALRIGVSWAIQEVDMVPRGPNDLSMDAILTEQEWIVTGDRL
jgi:5-formyltetrahydrofolate cyclo-ligase